MKKEINIFIICFPHKLSEENKAYFLNSYAYFRLGYVQVRSSGLEPPTGAEI